MPLQILEDLEKVDEYIRIKSSPSEILADLDADYLVVMSYLNLGNEIRLSSNLYSFDVERPAVAKFILEEKVKKIEINDVVDKTVLSLLESLCYLGFVSVSSKCEEISLGKENTEYLEKIDEIRIPDLRRTKEFGFRLGASSHDEKMIYKNKKTSTYIEGYYSQVVPNSRIRGLDLGIGASIGVDFVSQLGLFSGVIGINGFFNIKAMHSEFQYSQLPLIVSIGGGIGAQGVRYEILSGPDEGEMNGVMVFATNYFAEVEFPVSEKYRFHGMLRRVNLSPNELKLDDFKFVDIDGMPTTAAGKLGGYYYVIGMKYTWR